MSNDIYNGWTNRETWAAHLWITNRIGFYEEIVNRPDLSGLSIRAWFDARAERALERRHYEHPETLRMLLEIGSLWRVNWDEIAKALSEEK